WMAARKDQPQPIVGDREVDIGAHLRVAAWSDRRQLRLYRALPRALVGLRPKPSPATQPVDGAVPGGGRDPRSRVRGHAALRPDLEGRDEGVLHRLLGELKYAEHTHKRRARPSLFLAE